MHGQPDQEARERTSLTAALQVSGPAEPATAGPRAPAPRPAPAGWTVPASLLGADQERVAPEPAAPEPESRAASLRERLEEVRSRAEGAASWLESSQHYARLLNAEGVVPLTARFDARDLAFLGRAREDLLAFAELGLRLAELHRPLDAGGTTSDPANPALRCRSCMWRWPCPTLRLISEVITENGPQAPS
ncbi:MAG TPA: hypothetical protein VIJ82_08375 [Streptosporangiaceae bacterium]|jgi:hypothetical protein